MGNGTGTIDKRIALIVGVVLLFVVAIVAPVDAQRDEPGEFEIATINGESADQLNRIEFHDDAPIVIELDGVDVSDHRFNVTIGDYEYRLFPDDEGKLEARRENPDEGQYTLTITLVHRGEERASAETEIEITDAGDRPDREREDDRDERPPETEREPDPDEEPPVDGDVDDVPGFGITAALLALSVALALAWSRAGERR